MYCVFSDESGSGLNYEDKVQPVLCQTAVIVENTNIPNIEEETKKILLRFGLPEHQEIHAHTCLLGKENYQNFDKKQRHEFLREFIQINLKYIYKIHYMGMLKHFVNEKVREKARKAGLDPFMIGFIWLIIIIDKHFDHILNESYKYYFDTTDTYRKKIKISIEVLKNIPQDSLKINRMIGEPEEIDSKDSRPIQLADVIGYYLNRHRQLEIPAFNHRKSLDKHRDEIFEIYKIIKPKILNFINALLLKIDWRALQNFDFIRIKKNKMK